MDGVGEWASTQPGLTRAPGAGISEQEGRDAGMGLRGGCAACGWLLGCVASVVVVWAVVPPSFFFSLSWPVDAADRTCSNPV